MKLSYLAGAALAAAAIHAPLAAQRAPSAHVRCDGNPDNVGTGESAARLLGAVTLLGIFAPPPELANQNARLAGAEGVAVCREVLERESNDTRRAQIIVATALHQIEADQYDAAIETARSLAADRPEYAASAPFRLSLRLSALEVEALALAGAGRMDEAVAKAIEMADAAPYDLVNQLRASRVVRLSGRFGDAERAFYDRFVRLWPAAVLERAYSRQMAGDFRGGAEDYDLWMAAERAMIGKADMLSLAHAALARALAGDVEAAERLAAESREALAAEPNSNIAVSTTEVLDLYGIWKNASEGRLAEARLLFANRSAWLRPAAPAVSEVARRLQAGAPAEALTGALAGDPARFREERNDRLAGELMDDKNLFPAIRLFQAQSAFDRFAANVWREGRSRYFARQPDQRLNARLVNVARDGFGTAAGYALLLHAALTARAEGHSRFMLMPLQTSQSLAWVRTGNAGDEHLIDAMTLEADRVIADLGRIIPRPARR